MHAAAEAFHFVVPQSVRHSHLHACAPTNTTSRFHATGVLLRLSFTVTVRKNLSTGPSSHQPLPIPPWLLLLWGWQRRLPHRKVPLLRVPQHPLLLQLEQQPIHRLLQGGLCLLLLLLLHKRWLLLLEWLLQEERLLLLLRECLLQDERLLLRICLLLHCRRAVGPDPKRGRPARTVPSVAVHQRRRRRRRGCRGQEVPRVPCAHPRHWRPLLLHLLRLELMLKVHGGRWWWRRRLRG